MIGQTLKQYRIIDRLGVGGMGVVYRAEDTKLQREVALKFLPEELRRDQQAREQLLHEARAASRLSHPHILTVHAIEESADGDFIVMEFVRGGTLKARSASATLPEIIELMIQAAEGLQAAHDHNIVHRDIKPENLLLDSAGRLKISDFGLAHLRTGGQQSLQAGRIVGTPYYMAPEQAIGDAIDNRTDIFSLGAVFYEAIAKRPPFEGGYDMAILYAVVNTPHTPLGELDPSLPPSLTAIVDRCLAKSPADRFENCAQLASALRQTALDPDSVRTGRSGPPVVSAPAEALVKSAVSFVGRETELATMTRCLQSIKDGHGQTVFLVGEPGVGKTRLAEWTLREARENGMGILIGRCLPHGGGLPYHPYATALRSAFPRADEIGFAPLAERAASLGIGMKNRLPIMKTFLNMSGEVATVLNQEQLWDAILALLRLISAERPAVLLLDDLHWADEDTLKFFSFIARSTQDLPLLQLATYRSVAQSEDATTSHARLMSLSRQLRAEGAAESLELDRLPRDAAVMLALQFMGDSPDPTLADRIAAQSDGNPLFIKELVGLPRGTADGAPQAAGSESSIPDRIRNIITQRVEHLDPDDRELLEFASCETEYFDSEALSECLGKDRLPLLRRLQTLAAGPRLIRAEGARYRFDHPLIRDTLYEGMLPELRVEYHRLLGDYLVRRHGSSAEHAARIAHHLLASGQSDSASVYLLATAERARDLCANSEARTQYERLLPILEVSATLGDELRARFALGFGDVLLAQGETTAALERFQSGLVLARRMERSDFKADFQRRIVAPLRIVGDFAAARAAAEAAVRLAGEIGDVKRRVEALTAMASVYLPRADYDRVIEVAAMARELAAETHDLHGESVAVGLIGAAHLHRGQYRESVDELERAMALQREIGDQRGLALSLNYAGLAYHRRARFSRSVACHLESLRIKRALDDVSTIPGSLNGLGDVYRDMWQLDEAIRCHTESLDLARHQSNRGAQCDNLRDLGADFLLRGELAIAEQYLNEVLDLARQYGYRWYETRGLLTLGELCLVRGRLDDATNCAEQAERIAEEVRGTELLVEAAWTRGRVLAARGEWSQAIQKLETAIALTRPAGLDLPLWQLLFDLSLFMMSAGETDRSHRVRIDAIAQVRAVAETIDDPLHRDVFLSSPRAQALLARPDSPS